jgi:hypothetical protein
MKASAFTPAKLLKHQQEHGFFSHHLATSTELLASYRAQYAAKRALYQSLFDSLQAGEVTLRTQHQEVRLLVDTDLMEKIIMVAVEEVEKDLCQLERWILEQATYVQNGINECGLDASPKQWAAAELLKQPLPTSQAA